MQPDTKELVEFIETTFGSHPGRTWKKTQLSKPAITLLQEIGKHMNYAEEAWQQAYPKQFHIEVLFIRAGEAFPKSHDYSYCPSICRHDIENNNKTGFLYRFSIHHRQYQVVLLDVSKQTTKTAKLFTSAIQAIYTWLYVVSKYATSNCSQQMNIYIYWTNLAKVLPLHGEPIGQIHANTAFTTSCKKSTEMNIYRKEEWFKVFIHESFHNMGLDFSEYSHEAANQFILNIFPVKSEVNLYESYTETWAEVLQIWLLAYQNTRNKLDMENMIKKTEKMLDIERMFSLFQLVKILHFYGLDYDDLIAKTETAHLARMSKYKESTNVLAYYIVKTVILFYVDDFLIWCKEHNESINFRKINVEENMMAFCQFIGEQVNRNEFYVLLKKIEPWFHSSASNKKSIEHIRKTLRMTVYG
jgi:hypothetical protein